MSRTERRVLLWVGIVILALSGGILSAGIGYTLRHDVGGLLGGTFWMCILGALMVYASWTAPNNGR